MSDDLLSLPLDEVIKRKQKGDKNAKKSKPKKVAPAQPKTPKQMQKNQAQKNGSSAQGKKKRPAASKPGDNNLAKTKKSKQFAQSNPQQKGERKRPNKIPVASQGVNKQGQRKKTPIKSRKNSQGNPNRSPAQTVRRNQNKRKQNGNPSQQKNQTNATPVKIIVPNDLADQPLENIRKRKHEDTRANVAEEFIALEPRSHPITKHNDSSRNRSVRRKHDIPEIIESDGEDEAALLQEFEMFRKMRRAEKRRRELSAQQDSEEQDVEVRNLRKVIAVGSSRTSRASASQEAARLRRLSGTGLFK